MWRSLIIHHRKKPTTTTRWRWAEVFLTFEEEKEKRIHWFFLFCYVSCTSLRHPIGIFDSVEWLVCTTSDSCVPPLNAGGDVEYTQKMHKRSSDTSAIVVHPLWVANVLLESLWEQSVQTSSCQDHLNLAEVHALFYSTVSVLAFKKVPSNIRTKHTLVKGSLSLPWIYR
jgi:hypothetical protein